MADQKQSTNAIDSVSWRRICDARAKIILMIEQESASAEAHKQAKQNTAAAIDDLHREIDELNQPNIFKQEEGE